MPNRRFPPPWSVDELGSRKRRFAKCYPVKLGEAPVVLRPRCVGLLLVILGMVRLRWPLQRPPGSIQSLRVTPLQLRLPSMAQRWCSSTRLFHCAIGNSAF
jgi:hypothetical protein